MKSPVLRCIPTIRLHHRNTYQICYWLAWYLLFHAVGHVFAIYQHLYTTICMPGDDGIAIHGKCCYSFFSTIPHQGYLPAILKRYTPSSVPQPYVAIAVLYHGIYLYRNIGIIEPEIACERALRNGTNGAA